MHIVQERLEQACSNLRVLKITDSGALSHVQLSGALHLYEWKQGRRHDPCSFAR